MKVIEIIKMGQKILEMMQKSCIKVNDVGYIGIYDDYERMRKEGNKKGYIVAVLAERYGISERKVYYLLKFFERDCKIGA